jgi:uncharacterized protein YndB with AHSA1/START domain
MKWMLVVAVGVAAVVGIVVLVGYLLPKDHVATRSATFQAPPEAIWAAMTEVEKFPSWRGDVKTVARLPDRDGRMTWVEDGPSGKITLAVEKSVPPRQLVLRIADPRLPFGGSWTYDLAPAAGGATLTITENGEIYNPVFRFMAKFVFGYEATMASYLTSLEKRMAAGQSKG